MKMVISIASFCMLFSLSNSLADADINFAEDMNADEITLEGVAGDLSDLPDLPIDPNQFKKYKCIAEGSATIRYLYRDQIGADFYYTTVNASGIGKDPNESNAKSVALSQCKSKLYEEMRHFCTGPNIDTTFCGILGAYDCKNNVSCKIVYSFK